MKIIQIVLYFVLIICEINNVLALDDAEKNDKLPKPDNSAVCTKDKCVMKCCSFGKFVNRRKILVMGKNNVTRLRNERYCQNYSVVKSITDLATENIFTKYPDLSTLEVKSGIFEANETFMKKTTFAARMDDFNLHLTEDGHLKLELPNAYKRWTLYPNNKFCWDYKMFKITVKNETTVQLDADIFVLFDEEENLEVDDPNTIFLTMAMLISSFFLFVVLVVYGLLPELRTLGGRILMAYVASLMGAFILLAVIRMDQQDPEVSCLALTCCIYFLFVASFSWMNVMSYDIWWTFRGYAKARPIHRRGENFKFMMYCLYAWGLPFAMAIALAVLNNADMRRYPWFVTPKIPTNGCFISGGEKLLYLYMPMLILILSNWLFYIMTAFNVWRLSRGTAVLDSAAAGSPQAHRTHRHRFLVYLKLSVVMGLNWVLEVVSYIYPGFKGWALTDYYNILIGVSIFLIFVCKRKILKKLTKRILRCRKANWRPGKVVRRSTTSSSDSSSSQETQTLQICSNPKGPVYTVQRV